MAVRLDEDARNILEVLGMDGVDERDRLVELKMDSDGRNEVE